MTESASELVSDCVSRAKEAAAQGVLLRIPFETLFEYLQARPFSALGGPVHDIAITCLPLPVPFFLMNEHRCLPASQRHYCWCTVKMLTLLSNLCSQLHA